MEIVNRKENKTNRKQKKTHQYLCEL